MLTDREKALLDENRTLRRLLRPPFDQWGPDLRAELPGGKMLRVWFTVAELREIAALFAEGEDDDS